MGQSEKKRFFTWGHKNLTSSQVFFSCTFKQPPLSPKVLDTKQKQVRPQEMRKKDERKHQNGPTKNSNLMQSHKPKNPNEGFHLGLVLGTPSGVWSADPSHRLGAPRGQVWPGHFQIAKQNIETQQCVGSQWREAPSWYEHQPRGERRHSGLWLTPKSPGREATRAPSSKCSFCASCLQNATTLYSFIKTS